MTDCPIPATTGGGVISDGDLIPESGHGPGDSSEVSRKPRRASAPDAQQLRFLQMILSDEANGDKTAEVGDGNTTVTHASIDRRAGSSSQSEQNGGNGTSDSRSTGSKRSGSS